jgi:hypothetical protein
MTGPTYAAGRPRAAAAEDWHLYYLRPPGLRVSYRRDRLPSGVEVKSGASGCAAPQSVQPSCARYHRARCLPPAPTPDWELDRLRCEPRAVLEPIASTANGGLTGLQRTCGFDKSAASRRWKSARARGHLKHLETVRGRPARIVLSDPLPNDVALLPAVEALTNHCTVDRVAEDNDLPSARGRAMTADGVRDLSTRLGRGGMT